MAMITEQNKKSKNITHLKGNLFEYIACLVLFIKGYKILKRNFKQKNTSQIDILCQKNNQLIIVEVKYRKRFDKAIIAISPAQQQRLKKSAVSIHRQFERPVRVDLVMFFAHLPFFKHKKNIF